MKDRLPYNDIEDEFIRAGYNLISTTYKNAHSKLYFICPNGHHGAMTYSNFKAGKRCKYCSKNAPVTYERVKKAFEKEGYILLAKEYKSSNTKLGYICPKGTEGSITWNNFQRGHRCQCCYGKNNKLTIEKVKKSFEERGYTLLDEVYINSNTKLNYICDNGHNHKITWDSWKAGHGCPECAGNTKLNIEFVREAFKKEDYILVSDKYEGRHKKLKYICPIGHEAFISWGKWLYGRRCKKCADIANSGPNSSSWKGGISFEPYCQVWKDKEYKADIKERDGNICLNPYCQKKDGHSGQLTIHHIDYNKKNCTPENLITICRSCNARANTDRKWHEAWYKAIISKRYNTNLLTSEVTE